MSKKKLNTNGTLLNLLLLGGAAVILKKRTGSLRGVGATRYYQFSPIEDKLYKRQMELFEEWERADEENPMNIAENDKYYRDLIFRLEELQDKIYNRRWQKQFGNNQIGSLKRYYYYFMDDDYNVYDTCPIPDGVTKARAVKIAKQWMAENGFTYGYVVVNSMATGNILDQIEIEL